MEAVGNSLCSALRLLEIKLRQNYSYRFLFGPSAYLIANICESEHIVVLYMSRFIITHTMWDDLHI